MSRWKPVTSGVHQGSVLEPILCDIFTNEIDIGIECICSKLAAGTRLNGAGDMLGVIQRDLDSLEE